MARKRKDIQDEQTGDKGNELAKYHGDSGLALRWIKEIELVESSQAQRVFETHGERIVKKYRNADALVVAANEKYTAGRVMFNILHANVKVLKPTCYSRLPKPAVERTHKDRDPVGNLACRIAERCTSFNLTRQQDRANYAIKGAVEDMLLPGRGNVWMTYTCEFEDATDEQGNPILDGAGNAVRQPKPNTEKVLVDPLCWQDYLESLARNQYEVRWRAKKTYWTRAELVKEFGEDIGKCIELDYTPGQKSRSKDEDKDFLGQATIYIVLDLATKQKLWINKNYKDAPLKVVEDPYKLDEFWECPIPLLATTTTDNSYPTPDFIIYEKLANELDFTIKRLSSMTNCIRLVGATAAQFNKDIKNMLKLDDGALWPIDAWPSFVEKGGFDGVINWLPFDKVIEALPVLQSRCEDLKAQIYEITHIPDIIRGDSDAQETLGAQNIKVRSTSIVVRERIDEVQRFCREIISKMAQIIFEPGLFADETIALMCGYEQMSEDDKALYPEALKLLRDDRLRSFQVDIETDSTIAMDEDAERASRMQYLEAMSQVIGTIQQIQDFRPELLNPVIESALFTVRAFRTGRALEGSWERSLKEIEENDKAAKEQAASQPPPPDYEMLKIQNEQAKIQNEQGKQEIQYQELQLKQMDQQFNQWLESEKLNQDSQKLQMEFELGSQKLTIDATKVRSDADIMAMETELEKFQKEFTQALELKKLELEKYRVVVSEQEKVMEEKRLAQEQGLEVARLLHETKLRTYEVTGKAEGLKPKKKKKVIKIKTPSGMEYTGEANDVEEDDNENENEAA